MRIDLYSEDERNMLVALVQSPVYTLLLKMANAERQECLEKIAVEKDKDEILRLQGRALGCTSFKNAPKILAQYQVEMSAKEKAKKPKA